ncbi:MAG: FAD-dependent oxidoreductase [Alcaligenaceae bacterium]|nr:FAD-dependent oxidoreductase [Alcaligenaceae bacterium]
MTRTAQYDLAVIGAGIIGAATALYLVEAGKRVALIDAKGLAMEASFGNAGALAFAEILPMAAPGLTRRALKWFIDPLGPLSIPPAYAPRIAPWLLRLLRAGRADRYQAGIEAQSRMMTLAGSEMDALLARTGLADMVHHDGALELYETRQAFEASMAGARQREAHGIALRHVQGEELAALQPGLAKRFAYGTFLPGWRTVSDPHVLARSIGEAALAHGAVFLKDRVTHIATRDGGVAVTLRDGQSVQAAQIVVAAGAWSHQLARQMGDRIPLETERGYNTTLPSGAFDVRRQLTFGEHGFVVTPLDCGLRIGGAVELGGLQRPPDFRRAQAMLQKAQAFLPGLNAAGGTQWMGFRPSLPDTLPVIGHSTRHPAVIYAFGHGHLGLTQSAATARIVRDLVLGRPPAIPIEAYRPDRFQLL